ncbi:MAG: hypothetical protein ACK5LL_16375 [Suipraeoptans sp.]
MDEYDTDLLIDIADVVITSLSKTTCISLARKKPVIFLGHTQLYGEKYAYEVFQKEKLKPTISEALKNGLTKSQQKAFIKYVAIINKHYLFKNSTTQDIRYGQEIDKSVAFLKAVIKNNQNIRRVTI